MLDTLLFYLTDAIAGIGTILTVAVTVASHIIAFAFWWSMRKPHVLRKPHWYDTVAEWFDEREGFTWSLFAFSAAGLGVWAWVLDDLPTEMVLGLCLVVPLIGTWAGLLKRFSKA